MRNVLVDQHLSGTVAVVVVDLRNGPVDGELLEVGAVVAAELRVEVAEEAALEKGVLAKVDSADKVGGLEHDLLRLGEVVPGVPVQDHLAELPQWGDLLGDDLRGVKDVKAEGLRLVLVDDLDGQLPYLQVSTYS